MRIPLLNKQYKFPEYILKLCAATDLMHEYTMQLEENLQLSQDVAGTLVWNYRADELLNNKDNLIILKRDYVEDDVKKFDLKIAFIDNVDQALSFIAADMGQKVDGSIQLGNDTRNFEPVYMVVGGIKQKIWCKIEDNKMQFFLKGDE